MFILVDDDLRHGAATLAHAVGAGLETVQEQSGHTSIVLTARYTSVLMILHFKVAEAPGWCRPAAPRPTAPAPCHGGPPGSRRVGHARDPRFQP
jgi:hypothetical protein